MPPLPTTRCWTEVRTEPVGCPRLPGSVVPVPGALDPLLCSPLPVRPELRGRATSPPAPGRNGCRSGHRLRVSRRRRGRVVCRGRPRSWSRSFQSPRRHSVGKRPWAPSCLGQNDRRRASISSGSPGSSPSRRPHRNGGGKERQRLDTPPRRAGSIERGKSRKPAVYFVDERRAASERAPRPNRWSEARTDRIGAAKPTRRNRGGEARPGKICSPAKAFSGLRLGARPRGQPNPVRELPGGVALPAGRLDGTRSTG
jgi:hypothetical protein